MTLPWVRNTGKMTPAVLVDDWADKIVAKARGDKAWALFSSGDRCMIALVDNRGGVLVYDCKVIREAAIRPGEMP